MLRLIAFGLLGLPIAEILAFAGVAALIGLLWALALVLASVLAGIILLRWQFRAHSVRLRSADGRFQFTAANLDAPGIPVTLAAILFIIPGFLTDIAALAMLVPTARRWLGALLTGRARNRTRGPSVVDLDPDQWRRERDPALPDDRERRPRG